MPQEEATGNMHKNFVKVGHVVSEICERTDRQTDILNTILRTSPAVVTN